MEMTGYACLDPLLGSGEMAEFVKRKNKRILSRVEQRKKSEKITVNFLFHSDASVRLPK
jgi:hypothetical protein